jgi:photosystem II stability/assembly factor-like uncharacterized protein
VKNKSIGSLILLAVLAPACGGGGGGGGTKHPITPPRWSEQYRSPTSVDLRAVRFGDSLHGVAAGKFGTFVRTDDGAVTWHYLESVPNTPTGDVLALAVGNTTTFAVGGTPSGATPYTGSVAWQSLDATNFSQADSLLTAFAEPWVDVGLAVPATNNVAAGTLRLRPSGQVDVFQGTLQVTLNSTDNPPDALGNPVAPTPWDPGGAHGLALFGSNGYWLVCGANGGNGQIRRTKDSGQSKWGTLTLSAVCPPLNRFSMISSTAGFACGDGGTVVTIAPDPVTDPGPPMRPLPLGDYWKVLSGAPAGTKLRAVQAISTDTAFVVGDGGAIWRVRNASTATPAWDVIASPTGANLYDVSFSDPDHGYAVGDGGVVVKTMNGSVAAPGIPTWTMASGPAVNPTPTFNAVDVTADGSIALVVGNNKTLVRSINAGVTWSAFDTGIPGGANLTAVAIPRQGTETVAFVGTDTGAIYFTTNLAGAGSWTAAGGTAFGAAIKAMLFPKGDTAGVVAGASGKLAQLAFTPAVVSPATPASATVTLVDLSASPPPGALNALASDPAGNTLYVGGDGKYLSSSTNAGATWTPVDTTGVAATPSIQGLQAPSGNAFTLFAAADDGNVWRQSKGAPGSWSPTNTTNFGTPAGLAFISDSIGWVLTKDPVNGGVFYTNSSGASWFRLVLHVPVDNGSHQLNAIRMQPSGLGFVVGNSGVLIRTTTGGQ